MPRQTRGARNRRLLPATPPQLRFSAREPLCVNVLADSHDQIMDKLEQNGFRKQRPQRVPFESRHNIATGYLAYHLPRTQPQNGFVRIGEHVAVSDVPHACMHPYEIWVRQNVRAEFSRLIERNGIDIVAAAFGEDGVHFSRLRIRATRPGRALMHLSGKLDALVRTLDLLTHAWRGSEFNPGGVTTDLEYALAFLRAAGR